MSECEHSSAFIESNSDVIHSIAFKRNTRLVHVIVASLFVTLFILFIELPTYDPTNTRNRNPLLAIREHGNSRKIDGTDSTTAIFDFSSWAPLQDDIQLFSYSDRIDDGVCTSVESAILAGWTFQLVGPGVTIPKHGTNFDTKSNKIFALSLLMDVLPENVTIVFADSFDVLYQRTFLEFEKVLHESNYKDGNIVFGAENNCWPFNRANKKTYHCPLMQGPKWTQDKIALGCKLQTNLYENYRKKELKESAPHSDSVYLNSGLSLGVVKNYKKMVKKAIDMILHYPALCIDDQGIFAWQLSAENVVPMTLDYELNLFGSLDMKKLFFDLTDGLMKIKYNEKNEDNYVINKKIVGGSLNDKNVQINTTNKNYYRMKRKITSISNSDKFDKFDQKETYHRFRKAISSSDSNDKNNDNVDRNNDRLIKINKNSDDKKNSHVRSQSSKEKDSENNNFNTYKYSNLLAAPFLVHFNGGGKPLYNATRYQFLEFKKSKFDVRTFLQNKTFFLNGSEKKFIDICDNYMQRKHPVRN